MASLAEAIVRKNGFDGVVEVINSRVEDIDHLDELVVDVIVSEWMGEKEQEEEKEKEEQEQEKGGGDGEEEDDNE